MYIKGIHEASIRKALEKFTETQKKMFMDVYNTEYKRIYEIVVAADASNIERNMG